MSTDRHFISLILAGLWCYVGTPAVSKADSAARAFGQLPLIFERNLGQADSSIRYLARGHQYVVGLVDDGVELRLNGAPGSVVRMRLSGENRNSRFDATERLPGISNYLIGNDSRRWIRDVPQYGKISRHGVYPGIDVAYYGNQGQLEYDFLVRAGADPGNIRMGISGVSRLRLDANGDLLLDVNGAELRQKLPVAWQEQNGARRSVLARYRLMSSDTVGITVTGYDNKLPLIIDPVLALSYSTYLGGSLADQANGIAVDPFGNTWIAGAASSVDFPVTGSPKPVNAGGTDAFVAKLDPTGTMLLFSTYLGGAGTDQANGIAVDTTGNAYVTGSTNSSNFPTKTPLQMANAGGLDAFALKLTSTGSLVYSTYIGGTSDDSAAGIAVDANGNAYIAGYTSSTNFPTALPQQNVNHGGKDAFIVKLNAAGSALTYSTYLGGAGDDVANGIAVDSSGAAYVAGATQSSDFPLSAAFQTAYGGHGNAFVVKLNAGGLVVYSTYLGGSGGDAANAIAVDSFGDAYIAGSTTSLNFPVVNAFQSQQADAGLAPQPPMPDAFLSKLNPAGTALIFSTYFGGGSTGIFSVTNNHPGGADIAYGVALDATGNAYLTGSTTTPNSLTFTSTPFPVLDPLQGYTGPMPQGAGMGLNPYYHLDGFLASFSPTGSLIYATDLGGTQDDVATAVAVDTLGAAYVTGYSKSANFPLLTPVQATNNGTSNVFISKLTFSTPGVRVFFGASVPSASDLNVTAAISAPITVTGANCSAGNYTAGSILNGFGTPVIFQTGASCTISIQPNVGSGGVRWGFSSWGDGSTANPRTIAAPAHGTAYTINEAAQVLLTTSASPVVGGTIMVSPSSPDGYYPSGTMVTLTAVPSAGFVFSSFSGDAIGITNGQTVTMSVPRSVTAMFAPSTPPTISIDSPTAGAAISGNVAITGWAIDNTSAVGTAISVVQVKVDGAVVGNATYGTVRADVCSVYAGRPGCPNVGFTFTLNANSLVPGAHTIAVTAIDSDGTPDTATATATVTSSLVMPGTKVGVFRAGAAFLEDTNGNGVYDPGTDRFIASFTAPGGAQAGDIAVVGDWTGDGHAKVGIYRPSAGTWWLDANNNGVFDSGDLTYQFGGVAGDVPVVGDWNAVAGLSTHKDCIGLFRSGFLWVLDMNCNGAFDDVPMDAVFPFGGVGGDVPVVGKWSGGTTRVGVVRKYAPGGVPQGNPFFWVLDSGNANAGTAPANHQPAASSFAFGGLTGDVFVTGDWTGGGTSTAGVYRSGFWVLDGGLPGAPQASHIPGLTFGYGGVGSDIPVTGKW